MVTAEFKHGFIKTNQINLHYVSQGMGKLMLMLHGFPEFWYSWRHQIAEFASDYHVVAVDMRGYNDSDKPKDVSAYQMSELLADVRGVINGLGYEDCILVAHDWGGVIAWNFVYEYPEMIEKLIVMNLPHPAKLFEGLKTWTQLQKSWYIFAFQIPWLPELIFQANNYQAIASIFVDMAIDKSAFPPEVLTKFQNAAAKPGALTAMINYYRANFKFFSKNTAKDWNISNIPTLMIWGEADTALGKELTYGTSLYVRNIQIKYIQDCSHWVQQERPELVNQYLRSFLNN